MSISHPVGRELDFRAKRTCAASKLDSMGGGKGAASMLVEQNGTRFNTDSAMLEYAKGFTVTHFCKINSITSSPAKGIR